MGGPLVTGGNIQRLCAFGIPFLIPLLENKSHTKNNIIFIFTFIFMSMHHHFSFIYYITNNFYIFGLIVFLGALISIISFKITKK